MKVNNQITSVTKYLSCVICCFLAIISVWSGVFSNINAANAAPLDNYSYLVAFDSESVDKTFGAGTSDKIEGKAKQAVDSVKQNIDKMTGQAEATPKAAQGEIKSYMDNGKGAVEESYAKAERAAEKAIDSAASVFEK